MEDYRNIDLSNNDFYYAEIDVDEFMISPEETESFDLMHFVTTIDSIREIGLSEPLCAVYSNGDMEGHTPSFNKGISIRTGYTRLLCCKILDMVKIPTIIYTHKNDNLEIDPSWEKMKNIEHIQTKYNHPITIVATLPGHKYPVYVCTTNFSNGKTTPHGDHDFKTEIEEFNDKIPLLRKYFK